MIVFPVWFQNKLELLYFFEEQLFEGNDFPFFLQKRNFLQQLVEIYGEPDFTLRKLATVLGAAGSKPLYFYAYTQQHFGDHVNRAKVSFEARELNSVPSCLYPFVSFQYHRVMEACSNYFAGELAIENAPGIMELAQRHNLMPLLALARLKCVTCFEELREVSTICQQN